MSDMTPVDCLINSLIILKKYVVTCLEVEEDYDDGNYIYIGIKSEPSDEDMGILMELGWSWYYARNPNGTFTVYKNAWTFKVGLA